METIKCKPLSPLIFIPLLALISIRPFFSGLAYPAFDAYYQICVIFLAIITLFIHTKNRKMYDLPILILLSSYIISSIASINIRNSMIETINLIGCVSVFFIVSHINSEQKTTLIKNMVAAAVIISIYSIYQYFWGYGHTLDYIKKINSSFLLESSYSRDILIAKRAIGTFPSPILLGGYLITAFFFSLYLIKNNTRRWCVATVLITIALVLTKSMGAWSSLICSLFLLFIFSYKSPKKRKLIFAAGLISLTIIVTFIIINRGDRFMDLENPQNSITQRLNYWRTAIAIIKDHPIQGVGPGNFQEVYLNYKEGMGTETRYAHNIFLHQWAETGILGLIAIIFLIATFIIKSPSKSKYLFLAGLALIFHNLTDNSYFIPQVGLFWWIIIGLVQDKSMDNTALFSFFKRHKACKGPEYNICNSNTIEDERLF